MKVAVFACVLMPLLCRAAEPLLPTAEGTTWNYEMVKDRPSDSFDLTESTEERFAVAYRMGGTHKIDDNDFLRFEIYRGDTLESTDLIAVDEQGIVCAARADDKSGVMKFTPPQTMLAAPLKNGAGWSFDGTIGQTKVRQRYQVTGEEDVDVPAGKFHAWRIHCEQTAPAPASIDRWFVPGIGFVKVETKIKAPSGGVLEQSTLALKETPKIVTRPAEKTTPPAASGKLSVRLSKQPDRQFTTNFRSDTPAIYAVWHGRDLPAQANVLAKLIAEKVTNVAPNYEIDEAEAIAQAASASRFFKFDQPDDGWKRGDYRVDLYLNGELAQTAKFKISK